MNSDNPLADLRREIDAIDDQLHDLLMQRAAVAEKVRDAKKSDGKDSGTNNLRPGREAEVLRRLIDRHTGAFPKTVLVRLWREIFSAAVSLQGPFSVAILSADSAHGNSRLARSHFGSSTPSIEFSSARRIIDAVRKGDATVGVVPVPWRDEKTPWWPHLVSTGDNTPKIIARLPFAGGGGATAIDLQAMAISCLVQEKTGKDRSYLAVEADADLGYKNVERALVDAGMAHTFTDHWHDSQRPEIWLYLAEVDDFVAVDDARIETLTENLGEQVKRVVHLGGYAAPISADELA